MNAYESLPSCTNQALGLGKFATKFWATPGRIRPAIERENLFVQDALVCAATALKAGCNAPHALRNIALNEHPWPGFLLGHGANVFSSRIPVHPIFAARANCSAIREWDANGTNFGYVDGVAARQKGEFGHNDFAGVTIAAAQHLGLDGYAAILGLLLLDEIRGRLAEVFSLKDYKIDHPLFGAIGTSCAYGAMMGCTPEQIESAIGYVVAHHVPFRAIRAGKQLSDSKGASAAISAAAGMEAIHLAKNGFVAPKDIFRNPEAVFCLNEKPSSPDESPFDLFLTSDGDNFAIMGMHFKLGLYEHQSAGAIHAIHQLLIQNPFLIQSLRDGQVSKITVKAYQPAFGIIGDPAKRHPKTRQSADHSMVYILARLIRRCVESGKAGWYDIMLMPSDYAAETSGKTFSIDPETQRIMDLIEFVHGGEEYDKRYPDGIPTSVSIAHSSGLNPGVVDSGLIMYPPGHARCQEPGLEELLKLKWQRMCKDVGLDESVPAHFAGVSEMSVADIHTLLKVNI